MACYYSGAQNNSNCYELYSKDNNAPDRDVIQSGVEEVINTLGQKIDYYVNTYNTLSADNIYGEQPTSVFFGPTRIKMYIELTENALKLSRFGFSSDDEVTGYVSISGYYTTFYPLSVYQNLNYDIEPKSGDVFQMIEYGNDRPNNRAGNYFEITERVDQDIATINPLGGHYLWRLKAKRLEYTFQPGLTGERANNQVYDDTFAGKLSSTITGVVTAAPKLYTENVDNDSKTQVYNQSVNNTDVYGEY